MTDVLLGFLLPMGLAGGLFWLSLQLIRPLLTRLRASWRRALLLVCAVLFLLPTPLLLQTGSGREQPPIAQALEGAVPTAPVYHAGRALSQAARSGTALAGSAEGSASPRRQGLSSTNTLTGLSYLYWAGAALSLGITAVRHARLMRRLDSACTPVTQGEEWQRYQDVCRELGISNPPALYRSDRISVPILAGLAHSRVVLPLCSLTAQQFRFALLHELCHFKNRDLSMKYLMLLLSSLHWYNPAAHLLRREFTEVCEQNCDETVARFLGAGERPQYAAVLLDFARPAAPALVSALASPAKRLKVRLRRLIRPVQPGWLLRTVGILLPCSLLATALFAGCSLAAGTADSSLAGEKAVPSSSLALPPDSSSSQPVSALSTSTPPSASTAPQQSVKAAVSPSVSTVEVSPSPAASSADPSDLMLNPVPEATYISRGFAESAHRGVDLNAERGATIVAAGAGTVVTAGWHYSFGNYVVIDHGDGLQTLYAHNEENLVEEGQQVQAGDPIATVGSTGNSASIHCHVEVQQDDTLVNPEEYISFS